jgi:endo-1,4-beta-xylanase
VQGVFTYAAGDAIVAFAVAHNQTIRGHNLVWQSQVPSWLNNLSATALAAAMKSHITNVMGHWKGQLYCWGEHIEFRTI